MISCNLYAEPGKQNERRDFPVNASEDHKKRKLIEPTYEQQGWENSRFSAMKADKEKKEKNKIKKDKEIKELRKQKQREVPPPPNSVIKTDKEEKEKGKVKKNKEIRAALPPNNTNSLGIHFFSFLQWSGDLLSELLFSSAHAAPAFNQYGDIILDGSLGDWTIDNRINLPLDRPPYLASGDALYGKYIDQNSVYVIALKSTTTSIGANTTFWLNTDQDANTGFKIWGAYGGAEFFINIYSDSTPHLYNSAFGWVSGPLDYAYSADNSTIEIAIPTSLLSVSPNQSINILGDINDSIFLFPQDYAEGGQYLIPGVTEVLPPRTDFSKRVGIVFSETSRNNFFQEKAYSQLFMSLQHQAMMAGISFDLLNENELDDIGNIVNYDALIFPYFANVSNNMRSQIVDTLYKAIYQYGIGIIAADNWITNDETGASFSGDAYQAMKQLLGIGRVDGLGPVDINLTASDVSTPAMKGYNTNEHLLSYINSWYSYFEPVPGQPVSNLAEQEITDSGSFQGTYPAIIASTTGGRHVHFANLGFMGDGALVWQALQWIIYGEDTPVGLNLGRDNNLFISRNDMDQAMEQEEVAITHVPLYSLLQDWKQKYNFIGSFYIDIGDNPGIGQWTDWAVSGPLFRDYVALGNEIGTHSWTHPHFTDSLDATAIEYEFNQSMNTISTNLGFTWRHENIRGGAVPGAPESFSTATEILQHLDYLSGGWASVGAGYPNAFGYLTPSTNKVYFSPNMSFDFTLIEFGVPAGNPPVPTPLTAEEGEQYWKNEYEKLMNHASNPIIHWPWHDYGPTTSADPDTGDGYTVAMFENTIAMAYNNGAEFVTLADAAERIDTFTGAKMTVDSSTGDIFATVDSTDVGRFALTVNLPAGQVISSVDNWYAYNDNKVFLDDNGGSFVIHLGSSVELFSHVTALPMRSRLIYVTGDGTSLNFQLEGEGVAEVALNDSPSNFMITGASSFIELPNNRISLKFDSFGIHTINITR